MKISTSRQKHLILVFINHNMHKLEEKHFYLSGFLTVKPILSKKHPHSYCVLIGWLRIEDRASSADGWRLCCADVSSVVKVQQKLHVCRRSSWQLLAKAMPSGGCYSHLSKFPAAPQSPIHSEWIQVRPIWNRKHRCGCSCRFIQVWTFLDRSLFNVQ